MGIKMRPLVPDLSSGQTWPENPAPLFAGFDGRHRDDDDGNDYRDSDDGDAQAFLKYLPDLEAYLKDCQHWIFNYKSIDQRIHP